MVVLGWAILISYQLYAMIDWRDHHENLVRVSDARVAEATTQLTHSITQLQREIRVLREDSIRTRAILEMKFPVTAGKVKDAISEDSIE